jgi:hypothetical protein
MKRTKKQKSKTKTKAPKYGRNLWKNIQKMRKSAPFKKGGNMGGVKVVEDEQAE